MEQSLPTFSILTEELSEMKNAISDAQVYMRCMEEHSSCLSVGLAGYRNSVATINEKLTSILDKQCHMVECLRENTFLRTNNDILCREISYLKSSVAQLKKGNRELRGQSQELQEQLQIQVSVENSLRAVLFETQTQASEEVSATRWSPPVSCMPSNAECSNFSTETESTNSNFSPKQPMDGEEEERLNDQPTLSRLRRKMKRMDLRLK